jgi:hypothetical protein
MENRRATSSRARLQALVLALAVGLVAALPAVPAAAAAEPVRQGGPLNYAGPSAGCPGTGWNCTTSTAAVIQTSVGGENRYACTRLPCDATQTMIGGGPNTASCAVTTRANGSQLCRFTQSNDTGTNSITADQTATLRSTRERARQSSAQSVVAQQASTTGENTIDIGQVLDQQARTRQRPAKVTQTQKADQAVDVHQESSEDGDQTIIIDQDQTISATAKAKRVVSQGQNTTEDGCHDSDGEQMCPNLEAVIYAHTHGDGTNTVDVDQDQTLAQSATTARAKQVQGVDLGGLNIVSDVDAEEENTGSSVTTVDQTKEWTQAASGTKDQQQIDKMRVRLLGLTTTTSNTTQTTKLTSGPGAEQRCLQEGDIHNHDTGTVTASCTVDDSDGTPKEETYTESGTHLDYENVETSEEGSIAGTVKDATTGDPIDGATVEIIDSAEVTTTAADGTYSFTEVSEGAHTVRATASGFEPNEQDVDVTSGEPAIVNFNLSPPLATGGLRIILSWNETPIDLDSHLWLPADKPYHLYYSRQGAPTCPAATLDVDDTDGSGPETITFEDGFDGIYRYAVYRYSNDAEFAVSGATVEVYDDSGLIETYDLPSTAAGDSWWRPFDITFASGGYTLTEVQTVGITDPAPYSDTESGCVPPA